MDGKKYEIQMLTLFILLSILGASIASVKKQTYEFHKGEHIPQGKSLDVPSGSFIFQLDGNAVIYNSRSVAVWHTNTARIGSSLKFESDGNLVMYDKNGKGRWSSNSANRNGQLLVFQNDRNLVIFNYKNQSIWQSDTASKN